MAEKILTIVGPTASGKTRLSVELALRLGGEIVSCDSMQLYLGMDIGTAKPTKQERQGVVHHMMDVARPGENFSVARYVEQAAACVDDILARGKLPIVVGGTGLYHDALLAGRSFASFSGKHRVMLQERARTEGIEMLYRQLCEIDPERAKRLHPSDEKRVIRALEVWYETGKTITEHDALSRMIPPRYEGVSIGLAFAQRGDMWDRIDRRVDEMMEAGLEDEVSALLAEGIPTDCTAMQAIGYKELAAALQEGRSVQEAAEEIKLRTRQYAKRQLTWFRRNPAVHWFLWEETPDFEKAISFSTHIARQAGLL